MPFDPDAYLAQKTGGGGFDPDVYLAQHDQTSAGQAALQHFGNAASMGYLPQLSGMAMKGVGYLADAAAGVPEEFRGGGSYTSARDATTHELEQGAQEHPGASAAGSVGGALAGGAVMSGGLGLLGKAAGIGKAASGGGRVFRAVGSGAAAGAAMNPGDTEGEISGPQLGSRAWNAAKGGALGGALQGTGELVKKGIGAFSPESLDAFAETKALKAAGVAKGDLPKKSFSAQKGKIKDLGRTLLDEKVDMTDPNTGEAIAQKLVQAGDTLEDVAKKSAALKQQAGSQIGNIYKQVQNKLADSVFLKSLSPDQLAKVRALEVNPQHMVLEIENKLTNEIGDSLDGPEVMQKMTKYLSRIWGKGSSIDLPKLLKTKGEFDNKINYKRMGDLPETQDAYLLIRNHIRDSMNTLVSGVGDIIGGDLGNKLIRANRLYGNASELANMATTKLAGENANRMFGLTDTIAGSIGAGAGAGIGHAMHHGIEGAAIGAGAAVANKVGRTYGNALMASGANTLSKGIQAAGAEPVIDAAAGGVGDMAKSGILGAGGGLLQPSQKLQKGLIRDDQKTNRTLGSQ